MSQSYLAAFIGNLGLVLITPSTDALAANAPMVSNGAGQLSFGTAGGIRTYLGIDTDDAVTFGSVTVNDLTVNGTTTTINSATLSVEDSFIKLARNNSVADSLDIGFYGRYFSAVDKYAGLARDASVSGKWRLFDGLQEEPTSTVNIGGAGYTVSTLVANIEGTVNGVTLATGGSASQYLSQSGSYSVVGYLQLSGTPSTFAPSIHASTHMSAGTDAIRLDELKVPTDNTTLDVSITLHGLVPKAPNDTTKFLSGVGTWLVPAGGGGGVTDHGLLTGLADDDHAQYALLLGRATPQQLAFGTAASATAGFLTSTSHATKGRYSLNAAGTIVVDELNARIGIGTPTPINNLHLHAIAGANSGMCLSDADVTHPFTGVGFDPEITANVFSQWVVAGGTSGGAQLMGFTDVDATALYIYGHIGAVSPVASAVVIGGWRSNGTTGRTALTSSQLVFRIDNGSTPLVRVLGDGRVGINKVPDTQFDVLSSSTTMPTCLLSSIVNQSVTVLILQQGATPGANQHLIDCLSDVGNVLFRVDKDGNISRGSGANDIFNTTTGTKHGTSTAQKQAWWNATPTIQPASANQADITDSTTGTPAAACVDVGVVFSQAAINANFATILVLLKALRTAGVSSGLIKGAA